MSAFWSHLPGIITAALAGLSALISSRSSKNTTATLRGAVYREAERRVSALLESKQLVTRTWVRNVIIAFLRRTKSNLPLHVVDDLIDELFDAFGLHEEEHK